MKKYKINKGPKKTFKISKSDIQRHKNFNKLMLQYDEVTKRPEIPLYKNKKLFLFLIIISIVAYYVYKEVQKEESTQKEQNTEQKIQKIETPKKTQ